MRVSESAIWPAYSISRALASPSASAGVDLAQALGQRQEVAHRLRRLRRAHVHREGHELPRQGQADLLGDGVARLVLRLPGAGAQMGRDHHLGQAEQRRVGRGLGREHVERRPGHVAHPHGLGQRLLVDDAAPRHVDDADAGLGPGQQVLADEADGLGRLGHVQGHEVAHLDQPVQRHELDAQLAGPVLGHERVVGHQPHPEGVGPLGHQLADAAEAHHAEHLVRQLDALPAGPLPAALDQRGVRLGDVAGLGQQQRHGVLGRRQDVRLRRVDHHHAPLGGRVDVDVVEADAGPAHHHQVRAGLQHLAGHLGGGADDEGGRPVHDVDQLVGVEPEPDIDHVAGVTEPLEPAVGDLLGHEDARHRAQVWPGALARTNLTNGGAGDVDRA